MCGIAGMVARGPADGGAVRHMTASMTKMLAHRGPDDHGVWVAADGQVAFGHRRLSIVDLSPLGHQPMESADGRYVMTYNGEVYNFELLRQTLAAHGHRFRGRSDTEVMLAAMSEWGVDSSVRRFIGMFAFAVWDRQERRLFLVRDRLGIKPLYYGRVGDDFVFASELKAFAAHPAFALAVDKTALGLYLQYGWVPAPRSIYEGIAKLEPGTVLTLDASGGIRTSAFWSARDIAAQAEAPARSERDAIDETDVLLRDAVRLRMNCDVPFGAFLSGGVDSSTVVALMQAESARPVKTFTIGFPEAGYDEAAYARAVARHLGTEHRELYVTERELVDVLPRLPDLFDEPFADASQIPTLLVSRLAREEVTVALSGDGGDELFGGYNRHVVADALWERSRRLPGPVRRIAARALTAMPAWTWEGLARVAASRRAGGFRIQNAADKIQKLSAVLDADDVPTAYSGLLTGGAWQRGFDAALVPHPVPVRARASETMMYLDLVTYLPDDVLAKVDRTSMSVSLEVRVPLLDHRVVEHAWRLPHALKLRNGTGKWLLRQVLYRYVPPALVDRPKAGFDLPVARWLRTILRDWADDLLHPDAVRAGGYLDAARVAARWQEHRSGRRNRADELWRVLMLRAWLDSGDRAGARRA